jgi:hypothetical protein
MKIMEWNTDGGLTTEARAQIRAAAAAGAHFVALLDYPGYPDDLSLVVYAVNAYDNEEEARGFAAESDFRCMISGSDPLIMEG